MNSIIHERKVIPDRILAMTEEEQISAALVEKQVLGNELIMLAHHYQRDSIVNISDFRGDSFALSREAARRRSSRFIVFCGVHFMAESARVLASDFQKVFMPNTSAGCPMADMADLDDVLAAWEYMEHFFNGEKIIPVTYMNSSAAIKAFCGERGGAVCTSSNARKVFEWALGQDARILFLPDEHLGRNTADSLMIEDSMQAVWDPKKTGGGISKTNLHKSRVVLWKGFCHVHTYFTLEHVEAARVKYPGAKLIVHPECKREIVAEADYAGSTQFMVDYAADAGSGEQIIIGTEINLVARLAEEHPDKTIVPLARSLCHNMYKINPAWLLFTLESLRKDQSASFSNEIIVEEKISENAAAALNKMLELA